MSEKSIGPATIVHREYPHNDIKHPLGPEPVQWWEHVMPDGGKAAVVWLYESEDRMLRTIVVREWNNPTGKVYVRGGVRLGAQCSHATNELIAELAAERGRTGAA